MTANNLFHSLFSVMKYTRKMTLCHHYPMFYIIIVLGVDGGPMYL